VTSLRGLVADVTDEEYRPAVLLGLASVPAEISLTRALTPGTLPPSGEVLPLLLACLVAGALFRVRPAPSSRAGAVTGLVGGLAPALRESATVYGDWTSHPVVVGPASSVPAGVVVSFVIVVAVLAAFWLFGLCWGTVGGWLAGRIGAPWPAGSADD
jgi:hypothetical protein